MKRALVGIVTAASMGISFLSIAQGIVIKDIQTIVGGEKPIRNCSDESYLSIPISIGDPSRVYISTNVTSVASRVTLWATLTNASGVVLGSLPSVYNEPTTTTLSLSGLFHSGAVLVDKTADDLILSDGNYTINVMIRS